jgi:ankyrin repeat protein
LAIENNKFACARSLIELGSDIEQLDSYGRTPLLYACKLGSKQMVELLLSYNANIHVQNKTGDSCMSFAQKSGN